MERTKYHRLPGRHSGWLSRDSLWSCEDHLLLVQNNGFVERYRRYYFKDIQGFTVTPSRRGRRILLAAALPLLGALFLIGLSAFKFVGVEWAVFVGIMAVPCLFALVVNWLKGPTCTTRLYTAVSDVDLLPLGREKAAFKALYLISAFVQGCQGPLDPTQLGFFLDPSAPAVAARKTAENSAANQHTAAHSAPQTDRQTAARAWLTALGGAELLQAFSALGLVLFGEGAIRQGVFFGLLVLALLLGSVSLARGGAAVRLPGILALSHAVLVGLGSYISFYIALIRKSVRSPGATPDFAAIGNLDPTEPAVRVVLWLSIAGAFGLAVWCFIVTLRTRKPT